MEILDITGAQANSTTGDWELDSGTNGDGFPATRIFPVGDYITDGNAFDGDDQNCYVEYAMESAANATPSITVVNDGC